MPRLPTYRRRALEWISSLEAENAPQNTIIAYEFSVRKAWTFGAEHDWPEDPRKITPAHVRDFQTHLKERYRSKTQAIYTTPLLIFLRWAGNKSLDKFKLRIRPIRSKADWLTEEEVGKAFATAPSIWTKAMEVVFAYTGIRLEELQTLRLSELEESHLVILGKGSKGRRVPLTPQFWEAITPYMTWRRQLPGDHFLIHPDVKGHRMGPYSKGGIKSAIAHHQKAMGRHLSPHTFRRSFGRHLYQRGMPLVEIQRLYGHASLETTIQYLGITDDDLSTSINRYQPVY